MSLRNTLAMVAAISAHNGNLPAYDVEEERKREGFPTRGGRRVHRRKHSWNNSAPKHSVVRPYPKEFYLKAAEHRRQRRRERNGYNWRATAFGHLTAYLRIVYGPALRAMSLDADVVVRDARPWPYHDSRVGEYGDTYADVRDCFRLVVDDIRKHFFGERV